MHWDNRLKKRQKQEKRKARVEARARKRKKKLDKRHRKEAILRGQPWIVTQPQTASIFESGRAGFAPAPTERFVTFRSAYGAHLNLDIDLTTQVDLNWNRHYSYLGIPGRRREKYDWRVEGF